MKQFATLLHAPITTTLKTGPLVLRVTRDTGVTDPTVHALLPGVAHAGDGFAAMLSFSDVPPTSNAALLPRELEYLAEGDIVRIDPEQSRVHVMYRTGSPNNAVFVTERCNSFCVMCSQPPKDRDDSAMTREWLKAIPLMSPETEELGFTGGEPTLLGDLFLELLQSCKTHLPDTGIHVLSNGRMFNYLSLARAVADMQHQDIMIGIPLYSDIAWRHDHVVQARSAFDQTIRGMMNLARCHVPVEIRVVLHQLTIPRLPQLAQFITRNLPFASHIALMGYEPIGFGKANLKALWIDPANYQDQLEEAVNTLAAHRLPISIYNHQLCVLRQSLWPYARQSISDWKNIYLPACESCTLRPECGGFFHSAVHAHSQHIAPFTHPVVST